MHERTLPIATSTAPTQVISTKKRQISVVFRHAEPAAAPWTDRSQPAVQEKFPAEDEPFHEIWQELDRLVGLDCVKEVVYEIYALIKVNQMREQAGLSRSQQMYHMVFKGNPGTGKTTVARIVGKLFRSLNMLEKGHLIEAERADLVGEYIGHTAQKTRELIKKAMGGVLFIDEAYSLARGGHRDFGKEAVEVLVKAMEDYKDRFVLILAGYPQEMDRFLRMNPGLPSRVPIHIDFPDYTVDELIQIAMNMAKENEYTMLPQTVMKLKHHLIEAKAKGKEDFSNARYVRNLIEKSIRYQAVRLLRMSGRQPGRQELMSLMPEDFKF